MDLINSFESVTNKNKSKKRISTISKITMTLSRKIAEVYRKLKQSKLKTSFCKLYDCRASRLEIITTFLAVLELIKMNRIFANQKKQFKRIDLVFRRHEI